MEASVTDGRARWSAQRREVVRDRQPAGRVRAVRHARMVAVAILGAALLVGAMATSLNAQSYPSQPIRFVVPWPPGGANDVLARIVGPKLSERLGQPVVVENRPGAASNVGLEFVAKARPDGHTIVIGTSDILVIASLYKKLTYDPIKDLAPVWMMAQAPFVLLVKLALPVKNLKELVEYARANPGKLSYGSAGIGGMTHLSVELLKNLAKVNMLHAPYKGVGPAMVGLLGGEVDLAVMAPTAAVPQVEAGKVRALAVLGSERVASLPNVPTAKEAGMDIEALAWWGIHVPAGTPREIISRLSAECIKIAAMPDTQEQIRKAGVEPVLGSTPEQYSERIRAGAVQWAKVIKDANIPPLD